MDKLTSHSSRELKEDAEHTMEPKNVCPSHFLVKRFCNPTTLSYFFQTPNIQALPISFVKLRAPELFVVKYVLLGKC